MSAQITLTTVRKARLMRQAGWSYRRIADALGISNNTAQRYCDPDYYERQLRKSRLLHARRAQSTPQPVPSPEYLLVRAQTLRAAGMSCAAISILFRQDYGLPVSSHGVQRRLRLGEWRKVGRTVQVTCESCEQEFPSVRVDARWCSPRCAQRVKKKVAA